MTVNPRDLSGPEQKRRILCALRSSKLCGRLEEPLREKGYATTAVFSAVELIDQIAQESHDLVLLDSRLGGGDEASVDLLESLQQSGTPVPAVLFAQDDVEASVEKRLREAGGRLYRGKKIRRRDLSKLIDEALNGDEMPGEGELLSICERLCDPNPFVALGIQAGAEPVEVRRAYEELRRWLHPDSLAGSTSTTLERVGRAALADLEDAYTKLRDADSLMLYRDDPDRDSATLQSMNAADEDFDPITVDVESDDPSAALVPFEAGHLHLEKQEWPLALEAFKRAVEVDGGHGESWAYMGWATYLTEGGDPEILRESIEMAKKGMKLDPESFRPPLILGRLYQSTSRLDLAEKAFKRVLHLNPDSIEAVRELRTMRCKDDGSSQGGILSRLLGR